jgi:hypothetical protein
VSLIVDNENCRFTIIAQNDCDGTRRMPVALGARDAKTTPLDEHILLSIKHVFRIHGTTVSALALRLRRVASMPIRPQRRRGWFQAA